MALTNKQNRHLRALAHHLKPVVMVGDKGLTEEVVAAADEQLKFHELVKVKLTGSDKATRGATSESLAAGTRSAVVQVIGRTVVLYRPRKKNPAIVLPA